MPRILLAFSSVDGHTRKISERTRAFLEAGGHQVALAEITDAQLIDCSLFDKIVIGASIRYGKHRQSVYDFITRHLDELERTPSAFFSVSVVARRPARTLRTATRTSRHFAAGRPGLRAS